VKRFLLAVVLVAVVGGGAAAAAQVPVVTDQNARQTRDQLREILQQYPPSLADVLQLDPSLLTKEDYVAPYPALAAFLKQHAEIAHNPSFFLGGPRPAAFANLEPRAQAMRQVGEAVAGFLVFFGLLAVLGGGIYQIGRAHV